MGNTKVFLLVQDTGVPWKRYLSVGGFQTGLKVKTKMDYKKHRFWSWFFTKLNTSNKVFTSCLSLLLSRCCLKEEKSQMPCEEEVLQYHDTRITIPEWVAMARERLRSLSLPWKLQVKKCQAQKKSLQETWYQCFNITYKNINGYWSRSGQGPFKPALGLNFPMLAVAVGKCESPCGAMESRAARQDLRLSFVLPGLGCSLSWPQGH